jgi:hypothetical protein
MSFDTRSQEFVREPCFIATIEIPKCVNTYGVSNWGGTVVTTLDNITNGVACANQYYYRDTTFVSGSNYYLWIDANSRTILDQDGMDDGSYIFDSANWSEPLLVVTANNFTNDNINIPFTTCGGGGGFVGASPITVQLIPETKFNSVIEMVNENISQEQWIINANMQVLSSISATSTCDASGPANKKCFNTWSTCQDRPGYVDTDSTLKLSFSSRRIKNFVAETGNIYFPTLSTIDMAPSTIAPGRGLGQRSSVSMALMDHPYNDSGIDPYISDRTVVDRKPLNKSSLWAKMKTRVKFWENRKLIVESGFLVDGKYDADNFVKREYFIESLAGPTENGTVIIKAKDVLKIADDKTNKFPTGLSEIKLGEDIDAVQTTFNLDSNDSQILLNEIGLFGQPYIRVGKEVMKVITDPTSTATTQIEVIRNAIPYYYESVIDTGHVVSEFLAPSTHKAGDVLTPSYDFHSQTVPQVIEKLLVGDTAPTKPAVYSGTQQDWEDRWPFWGARLDQNYIDQDSFTSDVNTSYLVDRLITKPQAIKNYIDELMDLNFYINYDERILDPNTTAKIKLGNILTLAEGDALKEFSEDENILINSFSQSEQPKARVSQFWLFTNIINLVTDEAKDENYADLTVGADLESERVQEYSRPSIKKSKSQWIQRGSAAIGLDVTSRLINEYSEVKTHVSFEFDPKDLGNLWTGSGIIVYSDNIVDEFGEPKTNETYLITSIQENYKGGHMTFKVTAMPTRVVIKGYTENNQVDYISSEINDRRAKAYYSDANGLMSNSDPGYTYA